jgi:hypothetical protein
LGDGQSGEKKIAGKEGESQILLDIEIVDAPQGIGIALGGADTPSPRRVVCCHQATNSFFIFWDTWEQLLVEQADRFS